MGFRGNLGRVALYRRKFRYAVVRLKIKTAGG
jgi:hypothetical protein